MTHSPTPLQGVFAGLVLLYAGGGLVAAAVSGSLRPVAVAAGALVLLRGVFGRLDE